MLVIENEDKNLKDANMTVPHFKIQRFIGKWDALQNKSPAQ